MSYASRVLNEGAILNFGLWMQAEGYRKATCYYAGRTLKRIDRRCKILEPELIKQFLARVDWTESGKERAVNDLARFYKWKQITWSAPQYQRVETLPYIPRESELDQLISGVVNQKLSTYLQLLKETGVRAGEAWQLRWQDPYCKT